MRKVFSIGVLAAAVAAWSAPIVAQEKAPAAAPTLAGGWTRNADLSDAPAGRGQQGGDAAGRGDGSGGGGRRRGGGRRPARWIRRRWHAVAAAGWGAAAAAARGAGGGSRRPRRNAAAAATRCATSPNPPERLTIVAERTPSMVVLTAALTAARRGCRPTARRSRTSQHQAGAQDEVGRRQAGQRDQRARLGKDDADLCGRSGRQTAADDRRDGRRLFGAADDHADLRYRPALVIWRSSGTLLGHSERVWC